MFKILVDVYIVQALMDTVCIYLIVIETETDFLASDTDFSMY